eukprot:scpid29622/ scgid3530/ WD repeat-containing protein 78
MMPKRDKGFLQVAHRVELASSSVTRFKSLRSGSFVNSRSQLTGSKVMAGKQAAAPPPPKPIVVLDADGKDVTPKPLFETEKAAANRTALASVFYGGTKADSSQRGHSGQESEMGGSFRSSVDAGFTEPFSRSTLGGSVLAQTSIGSSIQRHMTSQGPGGSAAQKPMQPVLFKESAEPHDLTAEELEENVLITLQETNTMDIFEQAPSAVVWEKPLDKDRKDEDEKEVDDPKELAEQQAKNEKYLELCKNRAGNDRYMQRGMQTVNFQRKGKDVQTVPVLFQDVGVLATPYDMYTSVNESEPADDRDIDDDNDLETAISEDLRKAAAKGRPGPGTLASGSSMATSMAASMAMQLEPTSLSMPGAKPPTAGKAAGTAAAGGPDAPADDDASGGDAPPLVMPDDHPLFHNEDLYESISVMERALAGNVFQEQHARYFGMTPELAYVTFDPVESSVVKEGEDGGDEEVKEPEAEQKKKTSGADDAASDVPTLPPVSRWEGGEDPSVRPIWTYSCVETEGRNVSCLSYNKLNEDILAVGYGEFTFGEQSTGLICCWTRQNPVRPSRLYKVPKDVMSLDFSKLHPSILACGLYDGTIHVYNIREDTVEPIFTSSDHTTKHTGPVWQVSFVSHYNKDSNEAEEVLVSVSSDGQVSRWAMMKSFERSDLISLKKTSKKLPKGPHQTLHTTIAHASKRSEKAGLLHKNAIGLCFDFERAKDPNIYIVGTGDGYLHKCSCSYNEQYLETYVGHTGPVYRVVWSPHNENVFLTCSGDWSVRLWDSESCQPFESLFSSMKAVLDVAWHPIRPTVFATVSNGCIEIWDLARSTLDPVAQYKPVPAVDLTFVRFSRDQEAIVVGDGDGKVTVYRTLNLADEDVHEQHQILEKLRQGASSNGYGP